jgi:hypothetical protein
MRDIGVCVEVMKAGPAADQPSRLRTPPGVGPRSRRLGAQVSVTRLKRGYIS